MTVLRNGTTVMGAVNDNKSATRTLAKSTGARLSAAEAKITALTAQIATINTTLARLNITALANFTSSTNTAFLAALSKLGHQTTSNANITNSNSALTAGDVSAINGVINAVNNLQSNLQSDGFEA